MVANNWAMTDTKARRGVLTQADVQAAANLRAIWNRKARDLNLTQAGAASSLGIGQSAVSQYLNARIPLGVAITLKWAALLEVDPTEIRPDITEVLGSPVTAQSQMSPLIGTKVPVVDLPTAAAISLGKTPLPATTAGEWRPCPVEHGPRTYYIRVPETDDSMVSTNPLERSYPPGSFVLIDPDYTDPTGKRAILALVEGQETPILRRAGVDAGEPYLWSTNERSRPIYRPFTQLGTARGKWED